MTQKNQGFFFSLLTEFLLNDYFLPPKNHTLQIFFPEQISKIYRTSNQKVKLAISNVMAIFERVPIDIETPKVRRFDPQTHS